MPKVGGGGSTKFLFSAFCILCEDVNHVIELSAYDDRDAHTNKITSSL